MHELDTPHGAFQDQFYNVSSGYWVRSDVSLYKAPQAAAISPLLISPARPIHVEIDHNTGNYVPFKFKQEHEFLPNPINTFFQILFCVPKIKVKIINYERTIDCLPSITQLMRFVI